MSHHHPKDLDVSKYGILFIHLAVHMKGTYYCCY